MSDDASALKRSPISKSLESIRLDPSYRAACHEYVLPFEQNGTKGGCEGFLVGDDAGLIKATLFGSVLISLRL
jgi:hypothetical protein